MLSYPNKYNRHAPVIFETKQIYIVATIFYFFSLFFVKEMNFYFTTPLIVLTFQGILNI